MLAIPCKTSNKEKKIFIARIAITSADAALSIYEYQFQMPGTKKYHIQKPIEIMLPKVVSIFIIFFLILFTNIPIKTLNQY